MGVDRNVPAEVYSRRQKEPYLRHPDNGPHAPVARRYLDRPRWAGRDCLLWQRHWRSSLISGDRGTSDCSAGDATREQLTVSTIKHLFPLTTAREERLRVRSSCLTPVAPSLFDAHEEIMFWSIECTHFRQDMCRISPLFPSRFEPISCLTQIKHGL